MQQLKQYREQNPGKTYIDFKQYADGGEIDQPSLWDKAKQNVTALYNTVVRRVFGNEGNFDMLDLSKDKLSRITSDTDNVDKILANEFVEKNFNTIRKAKDYINTNDTLLGDKKIQLSKIKKFYGIENSKLKVDDIQNFDSNTEVVPVRTKGVSKIKEIIIPEKYIPTERDKTLQDAYQSIYLDKLKQIADKYVPSAKVPWYMPGKVDAPKVDQYYDKIKNSKAPQDQEFIKEYLSITNWKKDKFRDLYKKMNDTPKYVTTDNDTVHIPRSISKFKTIFADEYGNSVFVNNLRDANKEELQKLNKNLQSNPKYPITIDNGRYMHYQKQNGNYTTYTATDFWRDPKSLYVIGTTKYKNGGEVPPTNKPKVPQEPIPYKGTLYKDRYGKKYTEDQVSEYYDNSTDEIDRFTGKPLVRGLKPALDLEDAANATPVGDAISAYDAYSSARQGDWVGAGLSTLAMLPFVPMSVKEFRRKYKGITPKGKIKHNLNSAAVAAPNKVKTNTKPFNTTVNKDMTQYLIDRVTDRHTINNAMQVKASNQGYKIAERLMDDPEYLDRALQVKKKFGDDYTQVYADIIDAYNNNPNSYLPVVDVYNNPRSAVNGSMRNLGHGNYNYTINADMADLSANLTEHEWSHYADFKRNLDRPDAHGDSNMFYQMSKDLDNKKIDSRDSYYQMPTEQKAHMNQLREYMFQNGYIGKRGDTIESKMMKNVLDDIRNVPSMKGVFRASQQFKNINKYTKWFNSIPLLGVGAAAMYNNQEKSN